MCVFVCVRVCACARERERAGERASVCFVVLRVVMCMGQDEHCHRAHRGVCVCVRACVRVCV